jgi:hypothetical protein
VETGHTWQLARLAKRNERYFQPKRHRGGETESSALDPSDGCQQTHARSDMFHRSPARRAQHGCIRSKLPPRPAMVSAFRVVVRGRAP